MQFNFLRFTKVFCRPSSADELFFWLDTFQEKLAVDAEFKTQEVKNYSCLDNQVTSCCFCCQYGAGIHVSVQQVSSVQGFCSPLFKIHRFCQRLLSVHSCTKVTPKSEHSRGMNPAWTQQVYTPECVPIKQICMFACVHVHTCECYPFKFTPCPLYVNDRSHPIWLGKGSTRGNRVTFHKQ